MVAAASATMEAATAEAAAVETATDCAMEAALRFEAVTVGAVEIAEAMVVAVTESTVEERGSVNGERGVKAPAERAIEDARRRE